jgi:FMN-dependent NADH-azoreductase
MMRAIAAIWKVARKLRALQHHPKEQTSMNLLHIDTAISGTFSVTRELTAAVVAAIVQMAPNVEVVYRDLNREAIPHLDSTGLSGLDGNGVLYQFMSADIVVIGAPMYNFSVPSQLKAWLDHILVAGRTFRYTPAGPLGLVPEKRVIIGSSRGGIYSPGSPLAALDFQESYLQAVFGLMGVSAVEVVRAEGVNLGKESRDPAVKAAIEAAHQVVTGLLANPIGETMGS